jgi:FtsH-binding integral membrane protein
MKAGKEATSFQWPLDRRSYPAVTMFFLNLLVILLFVGKAWTMAYSWTILPAALFLTLLLQMNARPVYLAAVGTGVFLITSKIYGYPVLDSLNLFGSLLLVALLVIGLLKHTWAFAQGSID